MKYIKASIQNTELCLIADTLRIRITSDGECWEFEDSYKPKYILKMLKRLNISSGIQEWEQEYEVYFPVSNCRGNATG